MTRDTDARLRSDASAREPGCLSAIAVILVGAVIAYVIARLI